MGDPHSTGPSVRGAARSAAPTAPGSAPGWPPTFADSEPREGPFGPLGVLGPPPPTRTGFRAPELTSTRH
eukprot:10171713-Alexandrium_andersonii.AAC.1